MTGCELRTRASSEPAATRQVLPAKITFIIDTSTADHTRYWQQFVAWFEEEHLGTKIDAILPAGQGQYQDKVLTLLAGGVISDLFHLNNRYILDFHQQGLLQSLDALLRRANFAVADVIPGVLIPYRVGRELVGIPRDNSTAAIYYNRDLFAAAGVKEPDLTWTWDHYLEAATKLNAPDRQRFGSTFLPVESPAPATHLSILRSFGGDWFDPALREVRIDSLASRRAFQYAADLRLRHHVVGRPEELPPGNQFLGQHAALHITGQGFVRNVKSAAPGFRWDMAAIPKGSAGRTNVVGTTGYCISKQAPEPEGGAVLLRFLMGERVQRDMMSEGRWTTPRKSLLHYALPSDGEPARFKDAILDRLLESQGAAMPSGFGEMETVFKDEMAPVWVGNRALAEALTVVKGRWSQVLQERNRARR